MSGLTPQQLEAVSLLSSGFSQVETAKHLNVSERTIQRWMKIPAFIEALENTKDLVVPTGVLNVTPQDHQGFDERAAVMGQVKDGRFVYAAD